MSLKSITGESGNLRVCGQNIFTNFTPSTYSSFHVKIIENNLTSSFSNFDQLFKLINDYLNEPENNVSNVEYYYENFNSIYKFTSTELVYNLLFMNDTKPFYKELDKQNNIIYRLNKKKVKIKSKTTKI